MSNGLLHRLNATTPLPFRIGRGADCELRLADPLVSRQHALIEHLGEDWILRDCQSTTGTHIEDSTIDAHAIRGGETVRLGMQILHLQIIDGELLLLAPHPARRGRLYAVPPTGLILGRSSPSTARLDHPCAARCCLTAVPHLSGFLLRSLPAWHSPSIPPSGLVLQKGTRIDLHACTLEAQANGLLVEPGPRGLSLDIEGLSVVRGGKTLLHDISFSAESGELVAVVGLSGQGKSSLLRALAGHWALHSGQISLAGLPLSAPSLRRRTAFLPQDTPLPPLERVADFLQDAALLRMPWDSDAQERSQAVAEMSALLELESLQARLLQELSGGERKRCALAAELLSSPGLLLVDEPTSGLDPAAERMLIAHLRHISWLGHTVVMTTHHWGVFAHADRVLILHEGALVFAGRPADALVQFGCGLPDEIPDCLRRGRAVGNAVALQAAPPLAPPQRSGRGLPTLARPWALPLRSAARLARRTLHAWLRDPPRLYSALLQPILLGICLRQILFPGSSAWLVAFALLLCGLWFSLSATIREIVADRPFLMGELRQGLSPVALISGKLLLALPLSWLQALLVWAITASRLDLNPAIVPLAGALALCSLSGAALGLLASSLATSQNQAVAALPLLVIPQVIFAGALVPLDRMSDLGRLLARAWPAPWLQHSLQQILVSEPPSAGTFAAPAVYAVVFSIFAVWSLRTRNRGTS